tara:strand:+ start:277 stop:1248 length:972 start_codon:yes stop_codon:yes gene_type:complete
MNNSIKKLAIVIHTEEEFDWAGGFYRSNKSVSHGKELIHFCDALIAIGAKITFALDYAFVQSEEGRLVIKHFLPRMNKDVEFATHLHPWVNPPHNDEIEPLERAVSGQYSFPGNLPKDAEFNKLKQLTDAIIEQTGHQPTTYLAGRYGIGENTPEILSTLGYKVDVSISPFADFSSYQGPDFSVVSNHSYKRSGLMNIPHSTGIVSLLPALSRQLNNKPVLFKKWNNSLLGKIVFKLCKVDRYRLSPEGFNLHQMKQVTIALADSGIDNLVFSFHSPSVKLGLTPYVESAVQFDTFLKSTKRYIDWIKENQKMKFSLVNELKV